MLASPARASRGREYIGKPLRGVKPMTTKARIAEGKQKAKDREVLEAETREELARVRAQHILLADRLKVLERRVASFNDED